MLFYVVLITCMLSGSWREIRAERILLLPFQMRANVYRHLTIARHLDQTDNDVYMAVPDRFPWQSLSRSSGVELIRYRQQDNETFYDKSFREMLSDDVNRAKNPLSPPRRAEEYQSWIAAKMCRWMLDDEEFLHEVKFMNFHVAVVDGPDVSPCNVIIPWLFGIQFVLVSSSYPPSSAWIHFPSFVPDPATHYTDRMTFWQRLDNLHTHRRLRISVVHGRSDLDQQLLSVLREKRPIRGGSAITWSEVIGDASLFISLRDHVLNWPIPRLPNHVTVPGILQHPGKELPAQLVTYMLAADSGVILVSFGSLYDHLDLDLVTRLFEAFRRLEFHGFRILMKMDTERQKEVALLPDGVPSNVWIVTWLPQNDVLAHPKTKLFISHCGINGLYEAMYHGVPVIGLPLYGDQYANCLRMEGKGVGICMDTWSFSPKSLAENFHSLLHHRSYKGQVRNISAILQHSPLPSQSAAFWIEHVAKHGAEHLQSAARFLTYNELWMLDILLLYFLMLVAAVVSVSLVLVFGLTIVKNKSKTE